jgi:hypothetical protein
MPYMFPGQRAAMCRSARTRSTWRFAAWASIRTPSRPTDGELAASTLLNESGLWHFDAIERALAHGHSNAVRGTYARGRHWDEHVMMAQWWSD